MLIGIPYAYYRLRRRTFSGEEPPGSGSFDGTVGWTDFSEFPIGANPEGITRILSGSGTPAVAIASDGEEGQVLSITGTGTVPGALCLLDSLGAQDYGEVLMRFRWSASGNHHDMAVFGAIGTTFQSGGGGSNDADFGAGGRRQPGAGHYGNFQHNGASVAANSITGTVADVNDGEYIWARIRITEGSPNDTYAVSMWTGGIGDEPSFPVVSNPRVRTNGFPQAAGGVGFMAILGSSDLARCSYFAFSNDPDNFPPPVPA